MRIPSRLVQLRERARLRLHFARVLAALRRAPAPDPGVAEARRRTLRRIRDYALTGRFPLHGGSGGPPRPVFVDAAGTHCAVAHLLRCEGRAALIESVVAVDNYGRIPALLGIPGLEASIAASGLTPQEATRVQPEYETFPSPCWIVLAAQVLAIGLTIAPVLLFLRLLPGYEAMGAYGRNRRDRGRRTDLLVVGLIGAILALLAFPVANLAQGACHCGYFWSIESLADAANCGMEGFGGIELMAHPLR